jgi:hypothetical protein
MIVKNSRAGRWAVALAALLAMVFGAGQAVAEPGPSAAGTPVAAHVVKNSKLGQEALHSAAAAGLAACSYSFGSGGPKTAVYACDTDIWVFTWPKTGTVEVSLLGSDGKVWDSWQLANGTFSAWTSMGGHDLVYGMVWGYASGPSGNNLVTMAVLGSDDNAWCRTHTTGWGGWYICNNTPFIESGYSLT